jgi:hypothetical protein
MEEEEEEVVVVVVGSQQKSAWEMSSREKGGRGARRKRGLAGYGFA